MLLIEIAKFIHDLFAKGTEFKGKEKENVTKVLDEISSLLYDTIEKLKQDVYPHGNCSAMGVLSVNLVSSLIGKIPQNDLKKLSSSLSEASQLENEYANRMDGKTIESIGNAAGLFKAAAILNKIK